MNTSSWHHGLQSNPLAAGHRGFGASRPAHAKDDPQTAERIGHALIDRVAILENFPLLGAPYPKRPGVRKLVSRPYIIFYRSNVEEGSVDILRYSHGAQEKPELDAW
jgi:plasmid stabilization system protein ParE